MYRNIALLVLIALTSSALGKPGKAEFKAGFEKCVEESGIDPESLKGPRKPMNEAMEDPKMRCFGACMMKLHGHFNEDGTMNIDNAVEHLPPDIPDRERIVEAIKECGTKTGEDDCETAYEITMCLADKNALPPMHGPHHHHH